MEDWEILRLRDLAHLPNCEEDAAIIRKAADELARAEPSNAETARDLSEPRVLLLPHGFDPETARRIIESTRPNPCAIPELEVLQEPAP